MKTIRRLAAIGFLAVAVAGPSFAQAVKAKIPFAFQTVNQLLTPGEYVLAVDVHAHRVVLTNQNGEGVNTLYMTSIFPPTWNRQPSVVFHKYGETYFLREIITGGPNVTLPVSKEERFAKRAAIEGNGPKMALIRVALK